MQRLACIAGGVQKVDDQLFLACSNSSPDEEHTHCCEQYHGVLLQQQATYVIK